MSEIRNNPKVTDDPVINANRKQAAHRAQWMGLSYNEALKAGEHEASIMEEYLCRGIAKFGEYRANGLNCTTYPANCDEFIEKFVHPVLEASYEVKVLSKSPDRVDVEFGHCPLLKGWQDLGYSDEMCAKLCDIAMSGDHNIANTLGLELILEKTLAHGDCCCKMHYQKKTENK